MTSSKTDLELINDVLKGHDQAYRQLVNKYKDYAYNLSFRMLKSKEDAEEACQDAFLKVFRHLSNFEGNSKFSTWLYTIVYRESLNRMNRRTQAVDSLAESFHTSDLVSQSTSGLDRLRLEDRKELINQAMATLRPREAAVLTLFYLEEQSLKEIGQVMDMTSANIKVILHRGRKSMLKAVKNVSTAPLNEWI